MESEAHKIPERWVCILCDEVVTDPHEHGIGLRFCERDVSAPCSVCRDYIEESSLALDFFNTATDGLICERCAVRHGVEVHLCGLILEWWHG